MIMASAQSIWFILGVAVTQFATANPLVGTELIGDAHFQRGLAVLHIDPPKGQRNKNDPFNGNWVAGVIQPGFAAGAPVWRAGQWYSRFDLATARREDEVGGTVSFFDGAKTVTFARSGSPSADLKLRLNGRTEWCDTSPTTIGAWPHLLVQQRFENAPRITALKTLHLRVRYRLNVLDIHRDKNWNDQRQTAKFSIFLTIQDVDPKSSGYGDYLWFGIPLFDSRYSIPHRYVAKDQGNSRKRGTNKFIFTAGGEPFGVKEYEVGRWDSLSCEILALVKTALKTAWESGFLTDRRDLASYSIGAINLGWEISGPVDAEMQISDLSLTCGEYMNRE